MTDMTGTSTIRVKVAERAPDWSDLLWKWFHSFNAEREIRWQGQVVGELWSKGERVYMVKTFDWVFGTSATWRLVRLSHMTDEGWHFYASAEEMRQAYDDYSVAKETERRQMVPVMGASDGEPV